MTDTGYDPNQHRQLLRMIDEAASNAKDAFVRWEQADALRPLHADPETPERERYDDALRWLEDAWRAENDYMKRATK